MFYFYKDDTLCKCDDVILICLTTANGLNTVYRLIICDTERARERNRGYEDRYKYSQRHGLRGSKRKLMREGGLV